MDLFAELTAAQPKEFVRHNLVGGEVWVMSNFLSESEAKVLFDKLLKTIHWKQEEISFYGKKYPVPRLTAWYGYSGFNYTYSGIVCNPEPWTKELLDVKLSIESYLKEVDFNSVLLNQYRDGNDKVSWHADDEKELGPSPLIASLSLGAMRRFDLKHKTIPGQELKINLNSGCLVIMKGELQHHWLHQIPVQKKVHEPRINLTFRTIIQ
jgi:alkylated DNA repair dioxygenase AlkB